ncbi:hypothetical protein [Sphingomonas sp. PB4P5]|uniref:hypothetical protein n=1 Tax=Parasphingomonas puruogangriensis TaxID=3096155 RepID=UPI002FCC9640
MRGYIGAVLSGWFSTDWLASEIRVAVACDPTARFQIVTRNDAARARTSLSLASALAGRLNIDLQPLGGANAVRGDALPMFLYAGGEVPEVGRSPTRTDEVLGCWPTAVADNGVGDVACIVCENNFGEVILDRVTIDEGAVIAAGAVVDRDAALRTVVVGFSARLVTERSEVM